MKTIRLLFFVAALSGFAACHTNNSGVNNSSDSSARAIKESSYDTMGVNPKTIGSGAGTGANAGGSGTNTGGAAKSTPAPGLGKKQ